MVGLISSNVLKHFTMKRYAITHINRAGFRVLTFANQGRNHFDTREEAQIALGGLTDNNSETTLAEQFGPHFVTLAVHSIECYDNGDSKGIYLETYQPDYDLDSTPEDKRALVAAFRSLEESN